MRLKAGPIGIVHSPFQQSAGTPIQASMAQGTAGTVEVFPAFAEGLKDPEGFDRIWLLYWFDRAAAPELIVTPYLDDQPHGVFATRASARPNPIGPRVTLSFTTPVAGHARLGIYDAAGRLQALILNEVFAPGTQSLDWAPGDLPAGVYWARLQLGRRVETRRLVLAPRP